MSSRNFLNLKLSSSLFGSRNASDDTQLEAALPADKHEKPEPPQPRRRTKERSFDLLRIPLLLMLGYASEESTRRYLSYSESR